MGTSNGPRRRRYLVLSLPAETRQALEELARKEDRALKTQAVRLLTDALRREGALDTSESER
jgi:hypothetical protein